MKPFRPYSMLEIERFDQSAREAIDVWSAHWVPPPTHKTSVSAEVAPAGMAEFPDDASWYRVGLGKFYFHVGGTAQAFSEWTAILLAADREARVQRSQSSALILRLIGEVLGDLVARLLRKDTLDANAITPDVSVTKELARANCGIVCLQLQLDQSPLTLALPFALSTQWNALLRSPVPMANVEPLVPRAATIDPLRIRLDVEFDGDALSVSELQDLRTGDVLLLKQSIRKPLCVKTQDGDHVGFCYLGRVGASRGVRLAKALENKRHV